MAAIATVSSLSAKSTSDYYQIPVADRELLQQAEAEVTDLAAQLELAQRGDEDEFDDDRHGDDDNRNDDAEGEDHGDAEAMEAADAETPLDATANDDDDEDKPAASAAVGDADDDREDPAPEKPEEEEEEEDVKDPAKKDANDNTKIDADDVADDNEADASPAESAAIADEEQPVIEMEAGQDDAADADAHDGETVDAAADEAVDGEADEDAETDDAANDDAAKEPSPKTSAAAKARAARDALFEKYKDAKRKRTNLLRNYKIQEVIKRRQILLVQAVKEERGNKGAALTTYVSLAGRYCVLMPNTARGGGISRKIPSATDRRRLRRVVDSLEVPQGMGLIIRTAGAKRTKTEIKRDYDYLLRLWESIRTLTLKSIAPCLVYEEANLIKRAIRDLYDKDISNVLVEGEVGYREAKDFMKMLMPSHAKNVQPYKERAPIFLKYGVEEQLDGMYQPSVRLKSGGYIVIHQTEALIAIDVNSGRSTRERNIELTALKTNIEAAQEAARQFRLRDLAGLIVIDFIDMEEQRNNRKVEKALKDGLKSDRARIQVGRISGFGLLELSRQRRRSGIVDGTTHLCPTCAGAGAVRSHEMAALRILRAIEGEAISGKVGLIVAHTSLDVSQYVLNHNRDWLKRIEDENGVSIEILADPDKAGDSYELEKSGAPRERAKDTNVIRADQTEILEGGAEDSAAVDDHTDAEEAQEEREDGGKKRRRRRRRRKDASPREQNENEPSAGEEENNGEQAAQPESAAGEDDDGEKPKRRRRRGRRGGRRNRKSEGDADQNGGQNAQPDAGIENSDSQPDSDASSGGHASADEAQPNDDAKIDDPVVSEDAPNGDAAPTANAATDAVAPDSAPEKAPGQPTPAEEHAEAASKSEKPSRKGWWQRATGL